MRRDIFYIVLITSTKYKVMACADDLYDAALTAQDVRRPSMCLVVRDGATGERYSFADLVSCVKAENKAVTA